MGDVHAERLASELGKADERIRQLEQLNATLSAEIDRSRPIVDAAVAYLKYDGNDRMQLIRLRAAINNAAFNYEAGQPK